MIDQLDSLYADEDNDPWRQWLRWASEVLERKRLPFVELVPNATSMTDAARPYRRLDRNG